MTLLTTKGAGDVLATASELDAWLGLLSGTVRQWARRYPDRLPILGYDDCGRRLYSLPAATHLERAMWQRTEGRQRKVRMRSA